MVVRVSDRAAAGEAAAQRTTANTHDPATRWAVVAHTYGGQNSVCGGVRWIGPEAPDHPLVLKDGDPPLNFDVNHRSMEVTHLTVPGDGPDANSTVDPNEYVARIRHRAFPGRGVTASYDTSRLLRFRTEFSLIERTDVSVHRLQDGPTANYGGGSRRTWMIPGLSLPERSVDYVIRINARSGSSQDNDFAVFGGKGNANLHDNLAPGWQTVRGRLDETQILDREIWLGGGANANAQIDVAWAEFWQSTD